MPKCPKHVPQRVSKCTKNGASELQRHILDSVCVKVCAFSEAFTIYNVGTKSKILLVRPMLTQNYAKEALKIHPKNRCRKNTEKNNKK